MAQARPSYSTVGAPARSLNPEQRTGHEVYTVLYDVYRGNTVVAGLIRGRCNTNTQLDHSLQDPGSGGNDFRSWGFPIRGHGAAFEEHATAD